jgi:hypothetical protein
VSWTHTRSKIAIQKRRNPDADVTELRRQLKAERTAEYIEKVLADWPPLTDQQRTALAELLKPVRVGGGA